VTVDRDDSVERLLTRRHPAADPPPENCLDPETIAAWVDGALPPTLRAMAEEHAAGCARCQRVLAAMVRSEPVAERLQWWRTGVIRWIAPLALAEAALLAWLIVAPRARDVLVPQVALKEEARTPPPAAAAPSPAPVPDHLKANERSPDSAARDELKRERQAAPAAAKEIEDKATRMEQPRADAQQAPVAALAAPAANALARKAAAPLSLVVASPDQLFAWRVQPTGVIERTTDGGATWTAQETLQPFVIHAGASPSAAVGWLVGDEGLVLVSVDGRIWQHRSLGQAVSLTAVSAADGVTATVTAADGRKFVTHDAGLTWAPTPVQENPAAPF